MKNNKSKLADLESKLRKDEEEMRELLRQKNWYHTYIT